MAQKVMYERFGEDFIVNFVAKALPEAHCPPELAEQYYQKLQVQSYLDLMSFLVPNLYLYLYNDIKELK